MYLRRIKSLAFLSEAAFGEQPIWTDDVISYCPVQCPWPFCEKTADQLMWHCEVMLFFFLINRKGNTVM